MKRLERLGLQRGHEVLKVMISSGTATAREAVESLRTSPNAGLRCEALAQLASSPDALNKQLLEMIDSRDDDLRNAALATTVRHRIRAIGPALVRLVEADGFKTRSLPAQRQLLDALYELNPARAEGLLNQLVAQHGLIRDDALDATRQLAAERLGQWAQGEESLAALQEAARRRWWNSPLLRQAATQAASAIAERRAVQRSADSQERSP